MPKINEKVTLKAFTKGSKCPATSKGALRLYNMRFCPYAERCVLVLEAKKIPHEVVNINVVEKPEWYFKKNSEGKVPAIEKDDDVIAESLVLCDYLDEVYPENPLHPKEPLQKAKNQMLVAKFGKVATACTPFSKLTVVDIATDWSNVLKELEPFEADLKNRKTKFFNGEKPGMVDFSIWPWFERFAAFETFYKLDESLFSKQFPKLKAWVEDMLADPVVSKVAHPKEIYEKYLKIKKDTGVSDFDLGL